MRGLLDKIKNFITYDADREFYAKVFPGSVARQDLWLFRHMTHDDLADVLAIENLNYPFPWTEDVFTDCFRAGYGCWVCEEMGHILAYGLVSIAVGEAHILNISVEPGQQGQGIGRRMLQHLIGTARGRAETVFLEVRPSNAVAIALYEDMGFNEIGLRKDYYPADHGREDAIMFALQLF